MKILNNTVSGTVACCALYCCGYKLLMKQIPSNGTQLIK